ncbi:MAG: VWA domain-containing protein [Calditrichaeota bacterium]|nr:VWA domain-containing protein [Calditrichota bacterium]
MKRLLFPIVFLFLVPTLHAVDKNQFDIIPGRSLRKTNNVSAVEGYSSHLLHYRIAEISMITGGYYTIGTSEGVDASPLDDHCGITFGHPYAMTSYPVLAVDGEWSKLDELFSDLNAIAPQVHGDTLSVTAGGAVAATFAIIAHHQGENIDFLFTIKNNDAVTHTVGMGLVFDPALGEWGDGCVFLPSGLIQRDTLVTKDQLPDALSIFERGLAEIREFSQPPMGMGITFQFSQKPDQIIFANWQDSFQHASPSFEPSALRTLYDLVLKMTWDKGSLAPGEETSWKISLKLNVPDFSRSVLMRWDLPSFFSLGNNLLFPRNLITTIKTANLKQISQSDLNLQIEYPYEISGTESNLSISLLPGKSFFQSVALFSREIYEDKIVPVKLSCVDGSGNVLDELTRNVFIPKTPVSDTGLSVNIDSVYTIETSKLALLFNVENDTTDRKLLGLRRENIFLYENNVRINEFSFGKDTTGGAGAADIIFVLDVTGSMGGEIDKVKDNIIEFADSLNFRGVDFRLGLVTFLDNIENIYPFTRSAQYFQTLVGQQYAHGGGDAPENSLEALEKASQYDFRNDAKRIAIWITDVNYHEHDSVTQLRKQDVINELLVRDITVHAIGPKNYKTTYYDPIIIATGGNYYNIHGNFRDILLDISRLKSSFQYLLSFVTKIPESEKQIRLQVHYAGLGGEATTNYSPPLAQSLPKRLLCYPNPFNPRVKILVNAEEFVSGRVGIYNILGQRIREFPLDHSSSRQIIWDAHNENGQPVSTGFFIVRLSITDRKGKTFNEVQKILYLK